MDFIIESYRIYSQDKEEKLLAELLFVDEEKDVLAITRTFVDESLRGRGVADKLMREALKQAKLQDKKIKPVCPYAVKWFEKHREFADLSSGSSGIKQ